MGDVTITFPGRDPIHTTSEAIALAGKVLINREAAREVRRSLGGATDGAPFPERLREIAAEVQERIDAAERNHDVQSSGEAASRESADGNQERSEKMAATSDGDPRPNGAASISGAQLRGLVERVERLVEAKEAIADDIKQVPNIVLRVPNCVCCTKHWAEAKL